MLEKLVIRFVYCIICITLLSCDTNYQGDYRDIKIFYNTPVWDLIKAIDKDDLSKVESFCKEHPDLINFQDSIYGITPLMRAIGTDKYESTKILLENGADPNLVAMKIGLNPILVALSNNWENKAFNDNDEYILLLLRFNADINLNYNCNNNSSEETNVIENGTSPLIYSIIMRNSLKTISLLVENGANINYCTESKISPSIMALMTKDIYVVHYLICSKNAQVPTKFKSHYIDNKEIITANILLNLFYELDSPEYKLKMDIVNELRKQDIDYDEAKKNIPDRIIKTIQQRYPDTWEEYIEKY